MNTLSTVLTRLNPGEHLQMYDGKVGIIEQTVLQIVHSKGKISCGLKRPHTDAQLVDKINSLIDVLRDTSPTL